MPTQWVMKRLGRRAAAALLLGLATTGCTTAEVAQPTGSTVPSSALTPPADSSGPQPPSPSPAPSAPSDVTVAVTIAAGRVTPSGANVRVGIGQTVAVSATSDVAESLHIHGYDKTLNLTPGQPTALTFVADQRGVFEIETHESGKLAAKLIVS